MKESGVNEDYLEVVTIILLIAGFYFAAKQIFKCFSSKKGKSKDSQAYLIPDNCPSSFFVKSLSNLEAKELANALTQTKSKLNPEMLSYEEVVLAQKYEFCSFNEVVILLKELFGHGIHCINCCDTKEEFNSKCSAITQYEETVKMTSNSTEETYITDSNNCCSHIDFDFTRIELRFLQNSFRHIDTFTKQVRDGNSNKHFRECLYKYKLAFSNHNFLGSSDILELFSKIFYNNVRSVVPDQATVETTLCMMIEAKLFFASSYLLYLLVKHEYGLTKEILNLIEKVLEDYKKKNAAFSKVKQTPGFNKKYRSIIKELETELTASDSIGKNFLYFHRLLK